MAGSQALLCAPEAAVAAAASGQAPSSAQAPGPSGAGSLHGAQAACMVRKRPSRPGCAALPRCRTLERVMGRADVERTCTRAGCLLRIIHAKAHAAQPHRGLGPLAVRALMQRVVYKIVSL